MGLEQVRELVCQQRTRLAHEFAQSGNGRQLCGGIADAVDAALRQIYQIALGPEPDRIRARIGEKLAIAALGSYGRREMAPYSDVDLLFLRSRSADARVTEFVKRLVRHIWDAGLSLGHNVATSSEVIALARKEVLTATALLDARLLFGDDRLFRRFASRFRRSLRWGGARGLAKRATDAIREEQHRFGDTVHLLEPDVKRSAGGLRQIQLLRWHAAAVHGSADFTELEARGLLGRGDAAKLEQALDFLLRVRTAMHLGANKSADILTRHEQLRIAQLWNFVDSPSLLGVEQFMRDYFCHTAAVVDIVDRFHGASKPRGLRQRARELVASTTIANGMWPGHGDATGKGSDAMQPAISVERAIDLAANAAERQVDIEHTLIESLRATYFHDESEGVERATLSREASQRFLLLLDRASRRSRTLRMLQQVGVLEQIIPHFRHARGLLQFNAYHKYTVDEHTFILVENAEALADEATLLGQAYRKIARKDLLYLAILLHDLGKGFAEDHSDVGARFAAQIADRLGLNEEDRRIVCLLVQRHLLMSHLAFRRDTNDPTVYVHLSREVGSEQVLRMLYVLTAADIMATGPGAFNQWRSDLLAHVYQGTLRLFAQDEMPLQIEPQIATIRNRLVNHRSVGASYGARVELLPNDLLAENPFEESVAILAAWDALDNEGVVTRATYRPETRTVIYTVLTHERVTGGIFSKLCGAIAAHHLDILSARIRTLADGTVLDRFEVFDTHHVGEPPAERCRLIGKTIKRILCGELNVSDALWSGRSSLFGPKRPAIARDSTKIVVENSSSETCTVIDVFTVNRRGLLYTLAKGINRLGLSVQFAKIATYADEVVDVFYVQEPDGRQVQRDDRVRMIQDHLANDIHRLASDPRSMGF